MAVRAGESRLTASLRLNMQKPPPVRRLAGATLVRAGLAYRAVLERKVIRQCGQRRAVLDLPGRG